MRRSVFTLVVAVTTAVAFAPLLPVAAVGPGGWDHVGVGPPPTNASLNNTVSALNTDNPGVLYVGGNFTSAGGNAAAQRIAAWDGTDTWSALGNSAITNGAVYAIAYHAGRVYAGGTFTNAGGNGNADYLAVWNGSDWAPFCSSSDGPAFGAEVKALQIVGDTLYVGGAFQDGGDISTGDYLVGCDLTTGQTRSTVLPGGEFTGAVYALAADSDGTLYAGGGFNNVATIAQADKVAAYDGVWHAMGTEAVSSFVRSLTTIGTDVYVGTDALNVAGIPNADHVARWDGTAWHAVGSNTAGTNGWFPTSTTIDGLVASGSVLVATGSFLDANGIAAADHIAYFDGATWRPLGSDGAGNGPLNGLGTALGIAGGKVYAGGNFTSAGGDSQARFLAAYALRQPDMSVGATATGPFVGNNVYNGTGVGEVRRVTVTRGNSVTSYVKVENDGIEAAAFKIRGTGSANGHTVKYFRGTTNVTTAVRNGTYATGSIAPRGNILLRMVVTVASSSAASATFTTTARSAAGTPPDAVRVVVKAVN